MLFYTDQSPYRNRAVEQTPADLFGTTDKPPPGVVFE
jgi:hypothetical protein